MVFVIGLALLVLVPLTIFKPFAGLLGLLAINIIQPGELYPIFNALRVERTFAILLFASVVFHQVKLQFPPITKKVLWFWAAMFASVPFAIWRGGAFSMSLDFGKTIIYHLLIVTLVTTERRLKAFLITFVLLIGWLGASSFYEYHAGDYIVRMGIDRAIGLTSSGGDPNALGITLVSALPLILVIARAKKFGIWRLVALGIATISIMTVITTGSRTSFFALVALIAVAAMSSRKRLLLVPAGVALVAIIWFAAPEQYKARYETVESLKHDESYQNRVLAWHAGWEMFKDYPIAGIGAGQFAVAAGTEYWPAKPGQRKIWLQPHSLYFQVIAELGLLGTFAFGGLLWAMFRTNRALSQRAGPAWVQGLPIACSFSMFVLLVAGYSGHNLYRSTWFLLAGVSAVLATLAGQSAVGPQGGAALGETFESSPPVSSEVEV